MRKILGFVEPTFMMTYEALYDELAGHLQIDREEVLRRLPPDEAVPALRYFRRQNERRQEARRLAEHLGVAPEAVFEACTATGPSKLLGAIAERSA